LLSYYKDFIFLLGDSRKKLPGIFWMFVFISVFDLIGLGMVGPFLGIVTGADLPIPDSILSIFPEKLLALNIQSKMIVVGFCVIILYVSKSIVSAWLSRKVIEFSQFQQIRLRDILLASYQGLPYNLYMYRNSSDYINSIQVLVPNFSTLTMLILQSLGELILSLFIVTLLIWANPFAFFLMAILLGISISCYNLFVRNKLLTYGREANSTSGEIIQYTTEALKGLREIRLLGQEKYFHTRLVDSAKGFANTQVYLVFYGLLPKYILETTIIIFVVVLSISTFFLEGQSDTLVFTLGLYGVVAVRMLPMARNLSTVLNRIHFYKDTVKKLTIDLKELDLIKTTSNEKTNPTRIDKSRKDSLKEINLQGISYTYPKSDRKILKSINLKIKNGDSIGIIGSSGSGKTTLLNVLLGLLSPDEGDIKLDGVSLYQDPTVLWNEVAYIPQELFFVDGSLKENIALGEDPSLINETRLSEAITRSNLISVIDLLPEGLDSSMGEQGILLSGGQRQRMVLARALYFKRKILVLDEATSSLDEETESEIIKEINKLRNHITVIYIAHRASTLRYCDRIYRMKDGKIEELTKEKS